jgi:hypothetical protein
MTINPVSSYSLRILDPYRPEPKTSTSQSQKPKSEDQDTGDTTDTSAKFDGLFDDFGATDEVHQMPHRHLFRSYFYQYHLIQVCSIIIEMVRFFYLGIGGMHIYNLKLDR